MSFNPDRFAKIQAEVKISSNIAAMCYNDFYNELYDYQQTAVDAVYSHIDNIGKVIMPTGSGKSRVQRAIMLRDLDSGNAPRNYLIASHRLLLNVQLIKDFIVDVHKMNETFKILFVGSSNIDLAEVNDIISDVRNKTGNDLQYISVDNTKSTLKKTEVDAFVKEANDNNDHCLIVSTYQSCHKLSDIHINVACFDEAHTTAGQKQEESKYRKNISKIKDNIDKYYFFTATQRVYGADHGMNDVSLYGDKKPIYEIAPRAIIDKGLICEPRFHIVSQRTATMEVEESQNVNTEIKTILDSFTAHSKIVEAESKEKLKGKMLVNAAGSLTLREVINSPLVKDYSKNEDTKIFIIGSHEDVGNCVIEKGELTSIKNRNEWLTKLNGMSNTQKAIILHIRILTEGIDVPNITGVLFTRANSVIDLLQSVGRAARRTPLDRANITSGNLTPSEHNKMEKPFAYVILPEGFLIEDDDHSKMMSVIRTVIETYDIPKEDLKLKTTDHVGITREEMPEGSNLDDPEFDLSSAPEVKELFHKIVVDLNQSQFDLEYKIACKKWDKLTTIR